MALRRRKLTCDAGEVHRRCCDHVAGPDKSPLPSICGRWNEATAGAAHTANEAAAQVAANPLHKPVIESSPYGYRPFDGSPKPKSIVGRCGEAIFDAGVSDFGAGMTSAACATRPAGGSA
jgi:hypothetical protein